MINRALYRVFALLACVFCFIANGVAQVADTSHGEGALVFRNIENFNTIEAVQTDYKAVEMEDTIPATIFSGTSNDEGRVPYEVPTCIDSTVGIEEHYKGTVSVFPNPGEGINMHFPQELSGNHNLRISNVLGQQVLSKQFTGNQEYISLEHLADGAYIYQLETQGQVVATGKTIKLDGAPSGQQQYRGLPKSSTRTAEQKDSEDCEATYRVYYDAPEGFVDDSVDVVIAEGMNSDINILVQPWGTAYAAGNILTFDNTGNNASLVDLTLTAQSIENVNLESELQTQANIFGIAPYADLLVAVDTQGGPATTNAIYAVAWPFTPRPIIDSSATNLTFVGWDAGETTLEFQPGNNSNKFITLQRKAPPENYSKRFIEGYVGRLQNGSPGSVNTPAEDAIVVIQHDEGIDTAHVDVNGYFISPESYDHEEQLHIGAGYAGGQDGEGTAYSSYDGIDYLVDGASLSDLLANDTTKIYKMNLMPKEVWSGKDEIMVNMTAAQFQEMYQQPHYHNTKFDTVAYYVNTENMGPNQINNIYQVAQDMTDWTPLTYFEVAAPIQNEVPYNPETATATSHGSNVVDGDDNITNIRFTSANIQGVNLAYVSAQVNASGLLTTAYKELGFQRNAADDVSSRTSVMNSAGDIPNNLDIAIMSQKHHFDKEMFNSTVTPNLSFDYQNQTQNIGEPYLSDNIAITPQ